MRNQDFNVSFNSHNKNIAPSRCYLTSLKFWLRSIYKGQTYFMGQKQFDLEAAITKEFGYLKVVEDLGWVKGKGRIVTALCKCGTMKSFYFSFLKSGHTRSCGCLIRENIPKEFTDTTCGIYRVESPNGSIYIGKTRNMYQRWSHYGKGSENGRKMEQSLFMYGKKNHNFMMVHELPKDVSDEVLDIYEALYADVYLSCGFKMLNAKEGGTTGKYYQETRDKLKGKSSHWLIGKKLSKESIAKREQTKRDRGSNKVSNDTKALMRFKMRGENGSASVLKEPQVLEILKMIEDNQSSKCIAKYYGVGTGTINGIKYGNTWNYLTGIKEKRNGKL